MIAKITYNKDERKKHSLYFCTQLSKFFLSQESFYQLYIDLI